MPYFLYLRTEICYCRGYELLHVHAHTFYRVKGNLIVPFPSWLMPQHLSCLELLSFWGLGFGCWSLFEVAWKLKLNTEDLCFNFCTIKCLVVKKNGVESSKFRLSWSSSLLFSFHYLSLDFMSDMNLSLINNFRFLLLYTNYRMK